MILLHPLTLTRLHSAYVEHHYPRARVPLWAKNKLTYRPYWHTLLAQRDGFSEKLFVQFEALYRKLQFAGTLKQFEHFKVISQTVGIKNNIVHTFKSTILRPKCIRTVSTCKFWVCNKTQDIGVFYMGRTTPEGGTYYFQTPVIHKKIWEMGVIIRIVTPPRRILWDKS